MARHTRGAIIDSFWILLNERSLDKITVKDVIELAEINPCKTNLQCVCSMSDHFWNNSVNSAKHGSGSVLQDMWDIAACVWNRKIIRLFLKGFAATGISV